MTQPPASHMLARRRFLGLGLGLGTATALAACAPSPVITPQAGSTPMPAPTLDDARRSAAQASARLAQLAQACAQTPGADPSFTAWCTALAAQHEAHLQVLAQADPLGGVQADHRPLEEFAVEAVDVPADQAAAVALLASEETALAELLAAPVAGAGQSSALALLWISLRLAARLAAQATSAGLVSPAPVAGTAVPAEVEVGDATLARQVLLGHQRALVFGLQAMLGRADEGADQLRARLGEAMRERDATAAELVAAGVEPEPAAPDYALPGDENDPAAHQQLWGRLELAVLAGWARLAAADAALRESASANALVAAARVRSRGEALPYWPGWV